jgi:hypothetical protein
LMQARSRIAAGSVAPNHPPRDRSAPGFKPSGMDLPRTTSATSATPPPRTFEMVMSPLVSSTCSASGDGIATTRSRRQSRGPRPGSETARDSARFHSSFTSPCHSLDDFSGLLGVDGVVAPWSENATGESRMISPSRAPVSPTRSGNRPSSRSDARPARRTSHVHSRSCPAVWRAYRAPRRGNAAAFTAVAIESNPGSSTARGATCSADSGGVE